MNRRTFLSTIGAAAGVVVAPALASPGTRRFVGIDVPHPGRGWTVVFWIESWTLRTDDPSRVFYAPPKASKHPRQ